GKIPSANPLMTTYNSPQPNARPRVPVLFTGGTISMRVDPAAGGAVPALSGSELLALAPGAGEVAAVEAVEFDRVAGWRVTPEWVGRRGGAVRAAVVDPKVGGGGGG